MHFVFWISGTRWNRRRKKRQIRMNTTQIDKVLSKHIKYIQGLYPIDLLPSSLIKPPIIVFNHDKHYIPGWHCVAVSISDSGNAEYFESYGLPPYKLEIIAFLQRQSISWTFKLHRLQGLTSNVCGHYFCIYALHRPGGQTMTSFVDMFVPVRYTCND